MVKRLTMLLASLFLVMGVALAQTQVSGYVTSSEDGEPVIGASIKVVGTSTGTVTDVDGKFSLSVSSNAQLQVSYIGMVTKTVKAAENMKIVLDPDNKTLDEVMVVAFGKQTKASFTGSAAVVDSKSLGKKIATNVADALVGSVPGLQLTGASGQPGANQGKLHIRGISSLYASTDPLIIVDGAPYTASLSNIPSDDIESVTVLKDASSAALYGARGAAGVILITTKKGDSQNARINVEAKWGVTSRSIQDYDVITDPGEFMEAYYSQLYNYARLKGLTNEKANAWANSNMISNSQVGLKYNPFTVPEGESLIGLDGKLNPNATLGRTYTANGKTYYLTPDNWKDAAYRHGDRQEYNVNISGGNQKLNYYGSLGYLNEKGVLDRSSYNRVSARFKADYNANNWLHVYSNVGYVHSKMCSNPNLSSTKSDAGNTAYFTQYIAPIYPLYVRVLDENNNPVIAKDEYGHDKYDFGVAASNYPGLNRPFAAPGNPIGANKYNDVTNNGDQITGQFNFDITFTPWLKFTSTNSVNLGISRYSQYENPFIGSAASENGRIDKYNSIGFRQNYIQTLNFHKEYGLNDVQLMLGHEWYKQHSDLLEALARGGFSPDIQEINAFSDRYESYSYATNYNVEGYFANAMYNYDQKYFAQASYRRDASSRFAKNHRWGNFWSIGGAWIFSKENFFKNLNLNWVDQLKLKISLGQQGQDGIPDFWFYERYSLSKGNQAMLPSFYSVGNENITWETLTNFNVGLEFNLFNNRLNGELNLYSKKTTDMLFWLNIPESMGTRGYYGNIGDIRNSGFEFSVSGDIIKTKDITWSAAFNISHNSTKILKLDPSKTANYGGFSSADVSNGFNVAMWYEEGGKLYTGLMPEFAGVNEDGQALYWVDDEIYNQYAAGTLSNSSKPGKEYSRTTTNWAEASYYKHDMLPWANGGISTSVQIYNFDASVNFDYQLGGKIYDYGYSSLMSPVTKNATGMNYHKDVFKAWTPENTSSSIPRFVYGDQMTTSQSSRFLTSAKYLNFQSFTVGYTLPTELTKKLFMNKVRVYVQGQNLCFWSARKGLDPRFDLQGTTQSGVNSYAPIRTILGGIQLSF